MSAHLRLTSRRPAPVAARPAWQRLLLVLAAVVLVCAQQAATLHAVVHLADGTAAARAAPPAGFGALASRADAPQDPAPGAERHCDKCFQFAQVAGLSVARLAQLAPSVVAGAAAAAPRRLLPILAPFAPRSRGPPSPL